MTADNDPEILPSVPRPEITAGARVLPLVPTNFNECMRYAKMILMAGAVPDALTKEAGRQLPNNEVVARVVAVIAAGAEVGMAPMSAMANIALINKRRLIWGQGAVAVLQNSGQLEDMKVEHIGAVPGDALGTAQFADGFGIRVILKRKGQATPFTGEFTVGQAKRAHLWMNPNKKPWIEHPERMLFWRAFQFAAANGFADCLAGLGIREAVDELPPPPQITDTSFLDASPPREIEPPPPEPAPPESRPETTAAPRRRRRSKEEIAMDMFRPDPHREEVVPDTQLTDPDNTEPPVESGGDLEREPGEEG